MAENNYSVKVPLDSRDLPASDKAVVFDASSKKFDLQFIDDFRSTNICIEYKLDPVAGAQAMSSPLTLTYGDYDSPPSDGVVARSIDNSTTSQDYALPSFSGEDEDKVYLLINGQSAAYQDYLENLRDNWDDDSDRGIVFCYNSTFSESFFAFRAFTSAYSSTAYWYFNGCQFLDYQYNPFPSKAPESIASYYDYRWWRNEDEGNANYDFLFMSPDSDNDGVIFTGTQDSVALTANNKNIILTAKDVNGNDVKNYLVAEGGGTIKFVDKSNPENYIIKRFQRSFILRGDETYFSDDYYVVFTNLDDVAKGGTIAQSSTSTSDVFCVEVTPNDQGIGTNNQGGVPNNIYSPWISHRVKLDATGLQHVGRYYEGGYRGGNSYGYSTTLGISSREYRLNFWTIEDTDKSYSAVFTQALIGGNTLSGVSTDGIVNTYPSSNGVIVRPNYASYLPLVSGDDVGYPAAITTPVDNSANASVWVNNGLTGWVTYRTYFTNLNS